MKRGWRRIAVIVPVLLAAGALLPPLAARMFGWGPDPRVLPPRGKAVGIGNGLELNVIDVGSGSPIVLVHGLPSCANDWAAVPQKLAALGHRVVAYDRVGYGYSSRPAPSADRYTYDSNARDLTALLDALGIQRAALVGWSYGGAVVQTFAARAPDRVSHLILLAAVGPAQPRDDSVLGVILGSPVGPAILQWVSAVPPLSRAMTRDSLVQAFARADAIPQGWTEYTMAMLALPDTLHSFVLEAQRGDERTLRPEGLGMAALVLQGTDDYLVPPAVGEDLHRRLPHSRLVMIPHGSHMMPITHPDLVADEIHAFVRAPAAD